MNVSWNKQRRRIQHFFAAALCILLIGAPAAVAQISDQMVEDMVQDELSSDLAIPSHLITVDSDGGVITLTGRSNTILGKERAANIAKTVKGVKSVINRIDVEPLVRKSDIDLRSDIHDALLLDPATDSYEIDVSVINQIATLTGKVESWQEWRLAEKTAKGVKGLKSVNNEIEVHYKTNRTDRDIRTDIEQALRWDVMVDHELIDVKVDDGDVTLSGVVGSAAEKSRAETEAYVAGVSTVDASRLKVKYWARNENLRKNKYVVKSDDDVKAAVERALLFDPRVVGADVAVEVSSGIVTLRGEVDHLKARRAAGQDARNTVGVFNVKNRLKVDPAIFLSDDELAGNVREALDREPYIDRYDITVRVVNGAVNLYGHVDSYFEKAVADDVASKVAGVVTVDNNLEVDEYADPYVYDPYLDAWYNYEFDWYTYHMPGKTLKSDARIKEDLQSQLFWSPFVDAEQINIAIEDGVVTLSGDVDSWMEYHSAAENALEAGAVWVDNDLNVK